MTLGRGLRLKSWTLGLCLTLVLAGAGATRAHAQEGGATAADEEKDRKAKDLYEQGNTHYDLAEYDQAIDLFKQAYALSHRPTLLYNIAQAYRLKNDCEQALQVYKNYLRVDPSSPFRAKVESRIAEMETCVKDPSRKPVGGPEAIQKDQNGGSAGEGKGAGSRPRPDLVPPGGGAGATDATRGGSTKKLLGLVTAGVGVVALGSGYYFSRQASDKADQLEAACTTGAPCEWNDELLSLQSDGQSADTTAKILYGVGGAAIVGGVVLYVLGVREASAAPQVAFVPQRGGGGVVAAWAF
jgi:tetratricopeptide (TPR) repeat protein